MLRAPVQPAPPPGARPRAAPERAVPSCPLGGLGSAGRAAADPVRAVRRGEECVGRGGRPTSSGPAVPRRGAPLPPLFLSALSSPGVVSGRLRTAGRRATRAGTQRAGVVTRLHDRSQSTARPGEGTSGGRVSDRSRGGSANGFLSPPERAETAVPALAPTRSTAASRRAARCRLDRTGPDRLPRLRAGPFTAEPWPRAPTPCDKEADRAWPRRTRRRPVSPMGRDASRATAVRRVTAPLTRGPRTRAVLAGTGRSAWPCAACATS